MANNNAPQPLSSLVRGAGDIAGVDLANEIKSGTILPIANGGSGSASGYPNQAVTTLPNTAATVTLTNASNSVQVIDTTANAVEVDLPTAASSSGKQFTIKLGTLGAGNFLTIKPNGTDQIDGVNASKVKYEAGDTITLVSDGTSWWAFKDDHVKEITVNLTATQLCAMYAAPVSVLPAVAGKTYVLLGSLLKYTFGTSALASGGVVGLVAHTSGNALTGTVAATQLTAGSGSTYSALQPVTAVAAVNDGVDITNATGAFTKTTATGSAVLTIRFMLI